jgi:hypothetical protein
VWYHTGVRVVSPILVPRWHSYSKSKALLIECTEVISTMVFRLRFAFLLWALWGIPSLAQTYHDPVAYCRAVGTIDKPGSAYVGPKLPVWLAQKLNLKPDQASLMEWRCANKAVLACVYGANIPCDSKANTSQTPTSAILDYCRQNPNSSFIPMVVTGHDTSISWACHGDHPAVINSSAVDAQGYTQAYWKTVSP